MVADKERNRMTILVVLSRFLLKWSIFIRVIWLIIIFEISSLANLKMSIKYQLSKHVRTIILVSMDMNEDQNLGYLFSNDNYQQEQFLNYVLQEDNGQFNFQSSNLLDNVGPNNVEEATFLQKTNQGQGGQIFEERERIFQDVS